MKYLIFLIIVSSLTIVSAQSVHEETFNVPLSDPNKPGKLEVSIHNGGITIEAYSGKEVVIQMKAVEPEDKEEASTREGLKRISGSALDVEISEEDNEVEIDGGNSGRTDFAVKVPVNFTLRISTHHNGDIKVKGVKGEMELDAHHGAIYMEDVAGSAIADTHHGEIKGNFTSITSDNPMAFSTYHGDVDITFPSNAGFEAKVKTTKGDIFTDFDLEMKMQNPEQSTDEDGRKEIKIGGWMYGTVGSGGQEYMFNTYHGDIILRKS